MKTLPRRLRAGFCVLAIVAGIVGTPLRAHAFEIEVKRVEEKEAQKALLKLLYEVGKSQAKGVDEQAFATAFVAGWIAIATLAIPYAGPVLAGLVGLLSLEAGEDTTKKAIEALDNKIVTLAKYVEKRFDIVELAQCKAYNKAKLDELRRNADDLKYLRLRLAESPSAPISKADLTKVTDVARKFLAQEEQTDDLWFWCDVKVTKIPGPTQADFDLQVESERPSFKPEPTLVYYTDALLTWMMVLERASGEQPSYFDKTKTERSVGDEGPKTLSAEVRSHIAFLSHRREFRENADIPVTALEYVLRGVYCNIVNTERKPDGLCLGHEVCSDAMARDIGNGQSVSWQSVNLDCSFPKPTDKFDLEMKLEEGHGAGVMALFAGKLDRLLRFGTSREQYIGQFDMTRYSKNTLYRVDPEGRVNWFAHTLGTDYALPEKPVKALGRVKLPGGSASTATVGRNPAAAALTSSNAKLSASATSNAITKFGADAVAGKSPSPAGSGPGGANPGPIVALLDTAAALSKVGTVPSALKKTREPGEVVQTLEGPKAVQEGWTKYREVIPIGEGSLYALTDTGALEWFRHEGYTNGAAKWKGPIVVGTGFDAFKRIVPAGDGVLYGIRPNGTLEWMRHAGYRDGSGGGLAIAANVNPKAVLAERSRATAAPPTDSITERGLTALRSNKAAKLLAGPSSWSGPIKVGSGWADFAHVFSTGDGVIYAVTSDGKVFWYRHLAYQTGKPGPGQPEWQGPKIVKLGWTNLKRVFSSGEGDIYWITDKGELVWTRHGGYMLGTAFSTWWPPLVVATGWGEARFVFPSMPGPPVSSTVR